MAIPGSVGGDQADPDHRDARRADQRGHGHAARLRPRPVPIPGASGSSPSSSTCRSRSPRSSPAWRCGRSTAHPRRSAGSWNASGIHVIFAPLGILLALLFVTLPFVIRAVQPVLLELDPRGGGGGGPSGASGWTTFRRIVLPALRTAIVAGALLTFARSHRRVRQRHRACRGNIADETLTAPVFIFQLASQFRPDGGRRGRHLLFAISFMLVLVTARLIRAEGGRPRERPRDRRDPRPARAAAASASATDRRRGWCAVGCSRSPCVYILALLLLPLVGHRLHRAEARAGQP